MYEYLHRSKIIVKIPGSSYNKYLEKRIEAEARLLADETAPATQSMFLLHRSLGVFGMLVDGGGRWNASLSFRERWGRWEPGARQVVGERAERELR